MRKAIIILAILAALAAIVAVGWWLSNRRSADNLAGKIEVRIAGLDDSTVAHRVACEQAAEAYQPMNAGRLDDLSVPAAVLLRQLPLVADVDAGLTSAKPTTRLVHIRDWHFAPKDLYAIDAQAAANNPLTQTDIDLLYQEFLLQVELVQQEQMAMLRCLIKHHGLKRVYVERLTPEQLPGLADSLAALRELCLQPELRRQYREVGELLRKMAAEGKTDSKRYADAKEIEREVTALLQAHWLDMLDLGAAGRLLVAGELEEVLPLDDAATLLAAKPAVVGGKLVFDAAKVATRREAMVKRALAQEATAAIVLGGSHDLAAAVRSVKGEDCEYARVTVAAYRKFAGEGVR